MDLDNISAGNPVADIYRIYANFKNKKKEIALKTFFENYKCKLPDNFEKQIEFYECTHVLAYIGCWKQIVDSYNEAELRNMTKKMTRKIKKLLATSI